MRGAKRTVAVSALSIASIISTAGVAAACPIDEDCYEPIGPVGPVAPAAGGIAVEVRSDAFRDPDTNRWVYVDGSTTEAYSSQQMTAGPSIFDVLQRTINVIEQVFTAPSRYDIYEYDYGAPRG